MTGDLVTWLREQIASDRAHAEKDLWCAENATAGEWQAHYGVNLNASYLHINGENGLVEAAQFSGPNHQDNLMLATRFKPSTVAKRAGDTLAQCGAQTAVLDLHPLRSDGSGLCNECSDPYPCGTVRALALAHQHRPGYQEAWRWRT